MNGPEATIYDGDGKLVYEGPVSATTVDVGETLTIVVRDLDGALRLHLVVPQTTRVNAQEIRTTHYVADTLGKREDT